jgi:hypothetical protein
MNWSRIISAALHSHFLLGQPMDYLVLGSQLQHKDCASVAPGD